MEEAAAIEAAVKGTTPAPPDDRRTKWERAYEARRSARICGDCGGALGDHDTVYRLRFQRGDFGVGSPMHVLCESCVRYGRKDQHHKNGALFWGMWSEIRRGVPEPEAWAATLKRLNCEPCDGCGRRVVYSASGISSYLRAVVCSERCRAAYYNRRRSERTASAREKTCEVCGSEFTATRADARTCSPACRQKLYRKRLQVSSSSASSRP